MSQFPTPEQVNTLLQKRRSVFSCDYTGERIDDEIVRRIIDNARWAPTHKMTQPWRLLGCTGDGLKAFARSQAEWYKKVIEAAGTFNQATYDKLLRKPLLSSHIIAVLMMRDKNKSVPAIEEVGAVFCAVQNMYLTATAYGVGGYLSTGGITYYEEAKEFFGLEEDDALIGFFHLGVPRKRDEITPKRKPIDEISHWITTDEQI